MDLLKNKLKKMLSWKPDMRFVAVLSVVICVLLLIPLLHMAFYAVPWYDDYNFGKFVKNFLAVENNLSGVLKGALYCTKTQWLAWQGAYSASFLNSLMPAVWGEEYYFLGPIFLILILFLSVWMLVGVFVRDMLRAKGASCIVLQSVTAAMAVVLLHSAPDGFYWYAGGICYVGMHSFLMLLIVIWMKLITNEKRVSAFLLVPLSIIGAILVGGATYVTAIQGLLVGLSAMLMGALLRNKRILLLVPSMSVYAFGFFKNVTAPGNDVRFSSLETQGLDAVSAISRSFKEAFLHIRDFSGVITLVILILLAPIIWQMLQKSDFNFKYPGLLLVWSFCLYATGFTPSLYALGHAGLPRTLNAVKITYQVLLVVNEVYWLGWLQRKLKEEDEFILFGWCCRKVQRETETSERRIPISFYLVMGILISGIFVLEPNQVENFSSYGAYYYIQSGEAYNYHQEYLKRLEIIKNSEDIVVVEPYHCRPWILSVGELSDNCNSGANRAIALYYNKQAVVCQEAETD